MPVSKAFTELLVDLLAPVGPISVRRMFGGAGLFAEGLMFALIADDTLYLKADDANRAAYEAEGLGAFTYQTASGKRSIMSYWRAPERLLDDADEMQAWCRDAMAAAQRSGTSRKASRPSARPAPRAKQAVAKTKAGRKRPA